MIEKKCLRCGSFYKKDRTRSKKSFELSKYCSHHCSLLGNKHPLGRKQSEEERNNRSITAKKHGFGKWMKGKKCSNEAIKNRKGRICSEKTRKKLSEAHKGEKCYRWIKDRTQLKKKQERNDSAYQVWRIQVYKRDNYKCKVMNEDCEGRIEAHHILGWSNFPELRYKVNNGITLCHAHHPKKRAEEKRLIPYFQGLVSVSK
jgi:hypothetical protein